jgi:hypothetical protein
MGMVTARALFWSNKPNTAIDPSRAKSLGRRSEMKMPVKDRKPVGILLAATGVAQPLHPHGNCFP